MASPSVRRISISTIKPWHVPEEASRCELTPWDLTLLSIHYNQKGLLFSRKLPPSVELEQDPPIDHLKNSLSHVLSHFFPLAGRLAVETHPSSLSISIACNGAGADFIHAVASDTTVSDILTPVDVPSIVDSFFPFNGAVNFEGNSLPLLAVQLTELVDGFFLGCSFNHVVGDGTSFWHFFTSWAEISRCGKLSRPPITKRWFPDNVEVPIHLPFANPEEFIDRYSASTLLLRDRFFHFTHQSISRLKSKANAEYKTDKISSFQALSAHVWRSVTRARGFAVDRETRCQFSIDARRRLEPPLSRDYFGNAVQMISAMATAGELVDNGLGWAAWLVHKCVADHTNDVARRAYDKGVSAPFILRLSALGMSCSDVLTGSSPRFDVYGVDFGWGNAVAVGSGPANKFDGKITAFPGREGGGSVDLEICLAPEVMCALEADKEFMDAVSTVLPLLT